MSEEGLPSDDGPLPEVEVSFGISGQLDPDEITRLIGVQPSRMSRRGQRVRTPDRVIPIEDRWVLKSEPVITIDGTAQVMQLINRLEPLRGALRQVRDRYPGADFILRLVAYVPNHQRSAVPCLELDNQTLQRLADLGVTFTVDYTLLAPDDQPA